MKQLKKLIALVAILFILCPVNSYAESSPKLNHTSLKISTSDNVKLKVLNTTKKVTWSSSNKSIVRVSSNGKVVPVWFGNATITAKVGSKTLKCKVSVLNEDYWSNTNVDDGQYSFRIMPISKTKARVRFTTTYKGKEYDSGNMISHYKDGYYVFKNQGKYHITGEFIPYKDKGDEYVIVNIKKADLKAFKVYGIFLDNKEESS